MSYVLIHPDELPMLETLTVANLNYQRSWWNLRQKASYETVTDQRTCVKNLVSMNLSR